jgi:hypothetical protein
MGEATRQRVCDSFTIQQEADSLNAVCRKIFAG